MSRVRIIVVGTDPADVREVTHLIAPLIKPLEQINAEQYAQIEMFEVHPNDIKLQVETPVGVGYIDLYLPV